MFRFTDTYAKMFGGQMWLAMDPPTADQSPQDGQLNIRYFVVRGEPGLDRVVAGAPGGAPNGVQFTRLKVDFTRMPGKLILRDGVVQGPIVGATIDGQIDYANNDVKLRGTFIPLYGLNNAFGQIPLFGLFLGGPKGRAAGHHLSGDRAARPFGAADQPGFGGGSGHIPQAVRVPGHHPQYRRHGRTAELDHAARADPPAATNRTRIPKSRFGPRAFPFTLLSSGLLAARRRMSTRFTYWIIGGMLLGAIVGYALYATIPDPKTAEIVGGYFAIITDVFLRLIKMIIAPLVFSMLVVGIAHMGDTESIGRIGLKAMGWFVSASVVSLALGLVMVNLLRPGDNLNLPLPEASVATSVKVSSLTLQEFVVHMVPRSIIEAMANNEILQIVVFSIFAGVAVDGARGEGPAACHRGR